MSGSISPTLPWSQASYKWSSAINPVLANLLVQGQLLSGVVVKTGANTINHGLGRKLQGYFITLNSAATTFYDSQASNQRPDLTLVLNASGPSNISLWVF
jgi:hypothetical protein